MMTSRLVLFCSILLLFAAVMFVIFQPAFSYTHESEWSNNLAKINDLKQTHIELPKNQQFYLLVDNTMDEWKKSLEIFVFPKIQNSKIFDVQYYYPPPYYLPPPPPSYYLNNNFVLTVRLILEDDDTRDTVADFYVSAGGEQKYIDSVEFKDDGKAKVTFVLDRDKLNNREEATIETPDGSWSQTWYYYTSNSNEATINQRFN